MGSDGGGMVENEQVHHGTAALTLSSDFRRELAAALPCHEIAVAPICGVTNRWVTDGGLWVVRSRARGSLLIFDHPPPSLPRLPPPQRAAA